MYCTKCGKIINKQDAYCKYCGKKASINEQDTDEIEVKRKEKDAVSMKYFDFFKKWYLGFVIVINTIIVFGYINNIKDIYSIATLMIYIILYITIPIKLMDGLKEKEKFTFYLLISFFMVDYIFRIVQGTILCYEYSNKTDLLLYIIILTLVYGIWYIPNIIYFTKRKMCFNNK